MIYPANNHLSFNVKSNKIRIRSQIRLASDFMSEFTLIKLNICSETIIAFL